MASIVLIALILFSLGAYLMNKRRALRAQTPIRKALFNTQALIWISLFLTLFAVNQMVGGFGLQSKVAWGIAIAMLIVGIGNTVFGAIRYRRIYMQLTNENASQRP